MPDEKQAPSFIEEVAALAKDAALGIGDDRGDRITVAAIKNARRTNPVFGNLVRMAPVIHREFKTGQSHVVTAQDMKTPSGNGSCCADTAMLFIEGCALAIAHLLAPVQNEEIRKRAMASFNMIYTEAQAIDDNEFGAFLAGKK